MSKSSDQTGKREPRFEEALAQIEEVIDRIESGQMGLEESIASYERGMKLLIHCQNVLLKLEQKVSQLTEVSEKLKISAEAIEVEPIEEAAAEAKEEPRPAKTKSKPKASSDSSQPPDVAEEDIPF